MCLEEDPERYDWLDAAQLVKHAYGLAQSFPDEPVTLLYLYWEPLNAERFTLFAEHRLEIEAVSIPGLLVHRSAITHSALVVLAMSILSARLGWRAVRPALTSDFFDEPLACLAHEPR